MTNPLLIVSLLLSAPTVPPAAPLPAPEPGWALWERHCLSCHTSGGSAPLALDSQGTIARKAATIRTVLAERFMPPWLPAAGGPFAHELPTDAERAAIAAWASAGALGAPDIPEPPDAPGAAAPRTPVGTASTRIADGWMVPADGTFMRTFAEGTSPIDDALRRGSVRGLRMRRASSAVERAMLSLDHGGRLARLDAEDAGPGAAVHADVPRAPAGSLAVLGVDGTFLLPEGWALPVPQLARDGTLPALAAELHAVGRGAPLPGGIALTCVDAAYGSDPRAALRTATTFACGPDGALRVERGERRTRTVSSPLVRDADVGVIALRTDTRCTAVRAVARAPDGTERLLLEIPRYREGLDRAYRFDPPVRLAAGTVVELRTEHADDNALAKSQPMALLWCAAADDMPAFPVLDAAAMIRPEPAMPRDLPADAERGITWFDAVEACNARSMREGLAPAYALRHPERAEGHLVRAQVTRVPAATGWRLPRADAVAAAGAVEGWWWTDDEEGLSDFRIAAPGSSRTDALAPNVRIPGIRAGMTRPQVAAPGNPGHDAPSR